MTREKRYHLIHPEDLSWRPSNLMKIPNADYLERTGSENIGARLWRFSAIPGPGEFGHDTWAGDSWTLGCGATWLPGSYDPDLKLL